MTQTKPKSSLNPVDMRILEAVMRQPGIGVRDLTRIAQRSLAVIQKSLNRMQGLGLVTWDCGRRKTLRSTCKFIRVEELASA